MSPHLCLLVAVSVFIGSSVAVPVGNSTQAPRRLHKANVKFPPNSGMTSVRPPSGMWARDRNTTSRLAAQEEPFVFPEEVATIPKPKHPTQSSVLPHQVAPKPPSLTPRFKSLPPCANGLTFCEEVDEYPGSYLENILNNTVDNFHDLIGTDELKSPPIEQRFDGNQEIENPLCASAEQIVFPKVGKTKEDKWLFIVNQGSTVQGVRIEKCLKTGETQPQGCSFTEAFPIGYKTKCKQKYIYRKMLAVDGEGNPVTENFELPSCCACSVINEGLKNRIGTVRASSSSTSTPKLK